MFTYLISGFFMLWAFLMYKIQAHLIICDAVTVRYRKWKKLNNLVAMTEKNNRVVIWTSLKMLLHAMYISFLQYMNNTVRRIDNKTYEVTYVIDGKMYKMIVKPKRGPTPVLQVSNEEQLDVTNTIIPYMGPEYNWHRVKLSPQFFGYKSLTFELMDGSEQTYEEKSEL
jgi:hypothetical protein